MVADHGGNVVDVEHLRDGIEIHVRETAIKLVLQTRGRENSQEILDAARERGLLGAGRDGRLTMRIAPEVAEALAAGRPVVALESAIVTHGLPRPRNLEVARAGRGGGEGGRRAAGHDRGGGRARRASGSTTRR